MANWLLLHMWLPSGVGNGLTKLHIKAPDLSATPHFLQASW